MTIEWLILMMHALLIIVAIDVENHRLAIINEGFESILDLNSTKEKDLYTMAKEFCERCNAAHRIHIPVHCMTRLCGLMHWAQDAYRCNEEPVVANFNEASLDEAIKRALIQERERANGNFG